jgi:hypothetical protein
MLKSSALKDYQREMQRKYGDKLLTPQEVSREIAAHDRLQQYRDKTKNNSTLW